jgi:hypothetical protein
MTDDSINRRAAMCFSLVVSGMAFGDDRWSGGCSLWSSLSQVLSSATDVAETETKMLEERTTTLQQKHHSSSCAFDECPFCIILIGVDLVVHWPPCVVCGYVVASDFEKRQKMGE